MSHMILSWMKRCSAVLSLVALASTAYAVQPYNMPQGVTEISNEVYDLHMLILWICVIIGIVVFGAMFISIVKHRKAAGHQAAQFHESTTVEIIWTVIPFFILVGMAIPATKTLIAMEDVSKAEMTIKITGYQWMWRYDYLDHDVGFYSVLKTPREEIYNEQQKNENYLLEADNELVLPTNRKVRMLITSNDVIHAWWVPDLAVKKDAIPGFINQVWTKIDEPGVYRGQCAELCGRDHGFMPIVVRALEAEEFDRWLAEQKSKGTSAAQTTSQTKVN